METTARHCVSIQGLSFAVPHSTLWNPGVKCARSFSGFTNLTFLEVGWSSAKMNSNATKCTEFFTYLGNSCPKLKKLKLGLYLNHRFPFGFEQQLAFILGEADSCELIPFSVMDGFRGSSTALHRLQFDSEDITPICSSLQSFEVLSSYGNGDIGFDHRREVSSVAFMLRHIPGLKKLSVGFKNSRDGKYLRCSDAVRLLHEHRLYEEDGKTSDVIEMMQCVNGKFLHLNWTTNYQFDFQINLYS